MKTIAISMDENLLRGIDRFAASRTGLNRSRVIRDAVGRYLSDVERLAEEDRESEIFRKNRSRLARQTAALVKEQAKA